MCYDINYTDVLFVVLKHNPQMDDVLVMDCVL